MNALDQPITESKRTYLLRKVVKGLGILAALALALLVGDYAWYRTQMPLRFTHANWTGTWKTHYYGLSGRLVVLMPDPIPENQDFEAEALVYYPVYSVWKSGQFVKMAFVGNFSPEAATSTGEAEILTYGPRGKLKFRATAKDKTEGPTQIVDYVAMMNATGTAIIGSYVSQGPSDIGYFYIGKE